MSNYERIRKVIVASSLDASNKQAMTDLYAEIEDQNLADIADLFEQDASWVEKLNETRALKRKAIKTGDTSLFNEAFEKEKKFLEDLTFGLD